MIKEDDIGFLIKKVYDSIGHKFNYQIRKNNELTYSQYKVMEVLEARQNIKTSITDIQRILCISHPTAVGLVKRLNQNGYINIKPDSTDRRVKIITINNKNTSLADVYPEQLENILLKGISEEDKITLIRLLKQIENNLNE